MAGERVLVMRARHQGEATAKRLVSLGYVPIVAPLTQTLPLEEGLQALEALVVAEQPRWFLVTSARALEAVLSYCRQAGLDISNPAYRWALVGGRAAKLLQAAGGPKPACIERDVDGLIGFLSRQFPVGTISSLPKIHYLCGHHRKPVMEHVFPIIEPLPVYMSKALHGFEPELGADLAMRGFDWGLLYSPRAARLAAKALASAGLQQRAAKARWACLSADVAQAFAGAMEGAVPQDHLLCAATPNEQALLACLPVPS